MKIGDSMSDVNNRLIWLGAGLAKHPKFDFLAYSNVRLYEAQSSLCKQLEFELAEYDHVKIINKCITNVSVTEKTKFNLYSPNILSSLLPATGIEGIFPGLKLKSLIDVEFLTLTDLFAEIFQDNQGKIDLIIDMPCLSGQIVDYFCKVGVPSCLNRITVNCTMRELYKGGYLYERVNEILEKNYFVFDYADKSDPELPLVTYYFDKKSKHIDELKAENKRLLDIAEALTIERDDYQRSFEDKAAHGEILEKNLSDLKRDYENIKSKLTDYSNSKNEMEVKQKEIQTQLAKEKSKIEIDLEDLRCKFFEKINEEKTLRQIISELNEQLESAIEFYSNLKLSVSEQVGDKRE